MYNIDIIGVKFINRNQFGDFYWMVNQKEYSDSLFIFNDNEEYHNTCKMGAGNACMRIFNKHSKMEIPRSAGIPTGTLKYGGYNELTNHVSNVIESSIETIRELIQAHKYKRLYYSSELDGLIGTSIFEVDLQVRKYITKCIFNLSDKPIQIVKILPNNLFDGYDQNDQNDDSDSDSDN